MRERLLTATAAIAASIAILAAGTAAAAGSVVTNGGATNITSTSAVLNGTVDPSDQTAGDSAWAFQYGTTTGYGHVTKTVVIGPGTQAVSVQISGLTPNTTYHFQLVLAENINYSPTFTYSSDGTFTTNTTSGQPGTGGKGGKPDRASLASHRLKVHGGYVSVPFKCSGPAGTKCKGAVVIAASGKLGSAKKKTMYGCAGGSFSTTAGKTSTLRMKISKSCATLIKTSRHHRLNATLRATYSTGQSSLKTGVTLVG